MNFFCLKIIQTFFLVCIAALDIYLHWTMVFGDDFGNFERSSFVQRPESLRNVSTANRSKLQNGLFKN